MDSSDLAERYEPSKLADLSCDILKKVGLSEEHAQIVADSFISANLRGVDLTGLLGFQYT